MGVDIEGPLGKCVKGSCGSREENTHRDNQSARMAIMGSGVVITYRICYCP